MGKSTKRKLPSNPDDVNPTMPRAGIDDVIDEPPIPGPHDEDMDDIDYESEPKQEQISLLLAPALLKLSSRTCDDI
jgi:hypothetical protein